jgi:hypothetical protein
MIGQQAPFHGRVCPFCGVATEVPHETQEGCIAALHTEIVRMRDVLGNMGPDPGQSGPPQSRRRPDIESF